MNLATITIEKIVFGGKGLGHHSDGKVILVDSVLPGETVEVVLTEKKGYYEGNISRIASPSIHRVKSECPYYIRCGGCDLRHTTYDYELNLKVAMLKDTLNRVGKINLEEDNIQIIPSPSRNRYRIKTRFQNQFGKSGFYQKRSNSIVEVKTCLNLPEHLERFLSGINVSKPFFLETEPFKDKIHYYFKNSKMKSVKIDYDSHILMHTPGQFTQANRYLLKSFIYEVKSLAGTGKKLVELFSGSGFFTIPLSNHFDNIRAFEISEEACRNLQKSTSINNIENIQVMNMNCDKWEQENCDTLLLDPPREGCSKELAENINNSNINKIVYISCNASTFSRDLKRFSNYRLDNIKIIDMFPGTSHFEIISLFSPLNND